MIRAITALLCLASTAAAQAAAPAASSDAPKSRPPNVVMIISDDQAWTDYGFMGHDHIRTPHLDRLAGESLTFKRGYVPSSLCCPSLATIITGLYPHQHKVTSNDPPMPQGMNRLTEPGKSLFQERREVMNKQMDAAATLPRILGEHGYLSLQTGKWWQGHYRRGGFTHGMTEGIRHGDAGLKIGRDSMKPIFDFIETAQKEEKPFFVWYAPLLPHDPHTPPQRLFDKYKDKTDSPHVARYWAMVEWFDETCGQLLDHLKEQKLEENTIVVYVTDNGWIQDAKGPKYAPKSKQSQYDGGVRTPIMIRWPGKVKPRMSDELAMSIDLAPTLLRAIGIEPAKDLQGINLLDDAAVASRKTIYGECFTHNAVDMEKPAANLRWRWIIDGHTKLIVPAPQNEKGKPELYDLAADPTEEKDLAAEKPDEVERLTKMLDAWWPGVVEKTDE